MLEQARASGWTITAAGQQVLGGANPADAGRAHGISAKATTGERLSASILATTNQVGATIGAEAQPVRSTQSDRHVLGKTTVYLGCGYGQSAAVTYEVGYGWQCVNWLQSSISGSNKTVDGPSGFCGYSACLAEDDVTDVPSGWKVDFAEENETYGIPTPVTENCFF